MKFDMYFKNIKTCNSKVRFSKFVAILIILVRVVVLALRLQLSL